MSDTTAGAMKNNSLQSKKIPANAGIDEWDKKII